jgi:hypothetical protein
MAEIPHVTVDVESVIHKALADTIETIAKQTRIYVESVDVVWLDVCTTKENGAILTSLRIRSKTYHPTKE